MEGMHGALYAGGVGCPCHALLPGEPTSQHISVFNILDALQAASLGVFMEVSLCGYKYD